MLRTTLRTIPKYYNNRLLTSRLVYPTLIITNTRTLRRFQSSLTAETSYDEEQETNVNIKTPVNTTPLNGKFILFYFLFIPFEGRELFYLLLSLF